MAFSSEEGSQFVAPRLPRFDRVAMAYEAPEDVEGLKRTAVFDRQASRGG